MQAARGQRVGRQECRSSAAPQTMRPLPSSLATGGLLLPWACCSLTCSMPVLFFVCAASYPRRSPSRVVENPGFSDFLGYFSTAAGGLSSGRAQRLLRCNCEKQVRPSSPSVASLVLIIVSLAFIVASCS